MRGPTFEKEIEALELDLYDIPACYEQAESLLREADHFFFDQVLPAYELTYFNPGEPEAENENRSIVILLTGLHADLWTDDEERQMIEEDWRVPADLFWARLRVQQAKNVVEESWQYGLEEPEKTNG